MRVYLAAAMTNATRDLGTIRHVLECLERGGHEVPTRHVADPRGRAVEGGLSDAEVASRDLAWVVECDAVVAEVSTPSHGVGVEVATALQHGVPVLLLHRTDTTVSRLLLGLPGAAAFAYAGVEQIEPALLGFLANAGRRPRRGAGN